MVPFYYAEHSCAGHVVGAFLVDPYSRSIMMRIDFAYRATVFAVLLQNATFLSFASALDTVKLRPERRLGNLEAPPEEALTR